MFRRRGYTTRTAKPSLMTRLKGRNARTRTYKTTTTTTAGGPAIGTHHAPATHRRKTSVGDKISGAMLRLKGSLTRRPAVKAAGTRRMHGTDGRGSRRHRFY